MMARSSHWKTHAPTVLGIIAGCPASTKHIAETMKMSNDATRNVLFAMRKHRMVEMQCIPHGGTWRYVWRNKTRAPRMSSADPEAVWWSIMVGRYEDDPRSLRSQR